MRVCCHGAQAHSAQPTPSMHAHRSMRHSFSTWCTRCSCPFLRKVQQAGRSCPSCGTSRIAADGTQAWPAACSTAHKPPGPAQCCAMHHASCKTKTFSGRHQPPQEGSPDHLALLARAQPAGQQGQGKSETACMYAFSFGKTKQLWQWHHIYKSLVAFTSKFGGLFLRTSFSRAEDWLPLPGRPQQPRQHGARLRAMGAGGRQGNGT